MPIGPVDHASAQEHAWGDVKHPCSAVCNSPLLAYNAAVSKVPCFSREM